MNSESAHVVNFEREGLPTQFKSGFLWSFRLEFITDTDHEVKPCIVMHLLAKTSLQQK